MRSNSWDLKEKHSSEFAYKVYLHEFTSIFYYFITRILFKTKSEIVIKQSV